MYAPLLSYVPLLSSTSSLLHILRIFGRKTERNEEKLNL
jgi:hypothetical protein